LLDNELVELVDGEVRLETFGWVLVIEQATTTKRPHSHR